MHLLNLLKIRVREKCSRPDNSASSGILFLKIFSNFKRTHVVSCVYPEAGVFWRRLSAPGETSFVCVMISQPPRITDERFNVMMSLFSYDSPQSQNGRSVLCRVLDGRALEDICPVDQMILTPDERARYAHLRPLRSKALAYRTRAELRRMLGREIGLPPQMVPLITSAHGKPVCPHPLAAGLAFSVAHAEECAMIALGEVEGVGVDVEKVIQREPAEELLTILFSDEEQEQWSDLPPPLRCRAFTEAWTIKEAVLKAIGTGLDGSPHDVTVTFDHMGRATPVFSDANWIFERVLFCPCYTACLIAVVPERADAVREKKVTAMPTAA